jgi:hypothetical protein
VGSSEVTETVYASRSGPCCLKGPRRWIGSSQVRSHPDSHSRSHDGHTKRLECPSGGTLERVLAGQVEPPVGIEPTTYSLRVNRSAD